MILVNNKLVKQDMFGDKTLKCEIPETIKKSILDAYIDAKYYNYCGDVNVEFNKKNIVTRIDNELKKIFNCLEKTDKK